MRKDLIALPESPIDAARYQQVLDEDIASAQRFWVSIAPRRLAGVILARVVDKPAESPVRDVLGGL